MSEAKSLLPDQLSEEDVADYLRRHPGYFSEHPELLVELVIPHASGAATSLVERQLVLLREKNRTLECKLGELMEVARDNDRLSDNVHSLGLKLMQARSLEAVVAALYASLRERFGAERPVLRVGAKWQRAQPPIAAGFLVDEADPGLALFNDIFQSRRPRCGRLGHAQAQYLFGETDAIASAALVPLAGDRWQGVLAIAGRDSDHFQPGLGTLFLSRIGTLTSAALGRYLTIDPDA
jgi:uncharacterized protein YigA (DUF484 family)